MAQIPNKLLYFSQGSSYRTKREDEEIRDDSIVFVEDDASIVARQNIFGVRGVYPGTCTTAAGTAAKVATTSPLFPLDSSGKPMSGTTIAIKYSNTNSYKTAGTTMTLNVNSTGAYPIYYNDAEVVSTTLANTIACGYKDRYTYYIFNGTQWVWLSYGTGANDIKVGSVAGKLYRNDVSGSGNLTIKGNSGCIPNLTAGTFSVSIYAKSTTQSYTFRFNFGSISYDLSTTNGEINDIREITIPSNGTFSGSILNGSVAPGTIIYVVMYTYLTPVSTTIGIAAVTNRYSDLDGTPTIPTVPTNISSFTNDVGYITSTAVTNLTDIL